MPGRGRRGGAPEGLLRGLENDERCDEQGGEGREIADFDFTLLNCSRPIYACLNERREGIEHFHDAT